MPTKLTDTMQAVVLWLDNAPAEEVCDALRRLLKTTPRTATEIEIGETLAMWLAEALELPVGPAAEVAALRARVAALEALVPHSARASFATPQEAALAEILATHERPYRSSVDWFDGHQTVTYFTLMDGSRVNSRDHPLEVSALRERGWFAKAQRDGVFRREPPVGVPSATSPTPTPSSAGPAAESASLPDTDPLAAPRCASPEPTSPQAAGAAAPAERTTAPAAGRGAD